MYLITRSDLPPGQQAVQSAHALADFAIEHSKCFREWQADSNYIAILTVESEHELLKLFNKAGGKGLLVSGFREPDLNSEFTAIAIEPSDEARRLCSNLPLALKGE